MSEGHGGWVPQRPKGPISRTGYLLADSLDWIFFKLALT